MTQAELSRSIVSDAEAECATLIEEAQNAATLLCDALAEALESNELTPEQREALDNAQSYALTARDGIETL